MNRQIQQTLMRHALRLAADAGAAGEVPVAAIITDRAGAVIVSAKNAMKREKNPLAHAEMRAIAKAQTVIGDDYFHDCCLFVTLEPCPMCTQAIAWMRFQTLIFAAYDVRGGAVDHGARIFAQKHCNHVPEIIGGLCAQESETLLQGFFQTRR